MHTQLEAYKVPFDVIDVAQDSDALIHTSNFSLPHSPYLKEKWQVKSDEGQHESWKKSVTLNRLTSY